MVLTPENDHWTATGNGPLRAIAVEGLTRADALLAFLQQLDIQLAELLGPSSLTIH